MPARDFDAELKAAKESLAKAQNRYDATRGAGLRGLGARIEADKKLRWEKDAIASLESEKKRYGDIGTQFQEALGREAKPEEIAYFEKFMKEGQLDPYEVGQILKSTPEAQTSLQKKQYEELSGQLGKYDEQLLGQAQSQLTGQYRQMGRPFTSAYDNAFAQAAQQLAMNRQPFMTQYLAGGQGDLRSQYLGAGQQAIGRGYGLRDETRQRGYALEDYYRQADYYNNLMNQQNRWNKNQALFGAGGALLGAGIGAVVPGGGMDGAQLGGQLGGLFGKGAGSLF
mgnify:FL=1